MAQNQNKNAMNKENKFRSKLNAFIPKRVGNRVVAGFLGFSRVIGRPFTVKGARKSAGNPEAIRKHFENSAGTNGYVEDQSSYTDVKYGAKTMQYSGCGVFSVFNALLGMNKNYDPEARVKLLSELILEFERNGIVFSGNLGTDPKVLLRYFLNRGYEAAITYKASDFERMGEVYDSLILLMYNDGTNIAQNVHFITITKENGQFFAHNVYCNGQVHKPANSASELIGKFYGGRSKGICMIGIKNKSILKV